MVESTRHSGGNSGLPVKTLFKVLDSSADATRGPIRRPDKIPSSDEFLEKSEIIRADPVEHDDDRLSDFLGYAVMIHTPIVLGHSHPDETIIFRRWQRLASLIE